MNTSIYGPYQTRRLGKWNVSKADYYLDYDPIKITSGRFGELLPLSL